MHFKLNQKAIIEQFCINKSKPELQCNGTCHLTKELQETEDTPSEKIINTRNFDLAFSSNFEIELKIPKISKKRELVIYKEFQHTEPYLEILVPPPIYTQGFNRT
ncbi:hypothetical protein [Winogradskyella pacifica]|uniref:hypothetical protein n=1 Tax=Winogradskyella pacifica TaxID=664642 RepID=UPI0015CA34D8|nr:hypothetical protein [Winogradskyella pacifica]